MAVLHDIGTLTTPVAGSRDLRHVRDGAVVWTGDTIDWVGPADELPADLEERERETERFDAGGGLVLPGFVDCHTHLVFGGWREDEFVDRLRGRSYLDIARAGGGIARTVRDTRAASDDDLLAKALRDLESMRALGVTTVECKTGYGLSLDHEIRVLELYRELGERQATRLVATLLAAHVVPPEWRDDREGYVDLVVDQIIPAVAARSLASFCDVFVEESAFTIAEARRILEAGQRAGLGAKLHADQLSDGGGAVLAGEIGAVSADHLERISESGIVAMAEAGVVAVSLPLASLYLAQPTLPARRLLDAGIAVAVATDYNPGTAPSFDLQLAMWSACVSQRMTPSEVLRGVTVEAARALRLEQEIGSLEPGKRADLVVLDVEHLDHWLYHYRQGTVRSTFAAGEAVYEAGS